MSETKSNNQLCWDCKKATGGCRWADRFLPVDGWEATPTKPQDRADSFKIKSCPEFEADDIKIVKLKDIADILNIKLKNLYRIKLNKLKSLVKSHGLELFFYFDEEKESCSYGIRKITPPLENLKIG